MRKNLYRLLSIVGAGFLAASCRSHDLEPFRPVYREGDRLLRSDSPAPPDLRDRIKVVLRFYDVPFREDEKGELLIPARTARDLEMLWNYTTKGNDRAWLDQHRPSNDTPDKRK